MGLKNVFSYLYNAGFKAKRVDEVPLPKIDWRIPWSELDRRAGIRGEIDDYWDYEKEWDSGFYSNREPNLDRELRRTEWILGILDRMDRFLDRKVR